MTEHSNTVVIPRTDRFIEKFNARMKLLLGDNARVGREYCGWETIDGEHYDGACRAMYFDGRLLYVLEKDGRAVAILYGDMAEYKGRLIAEQRHRHHSIPELRDRVSRYMKENGLSEYTSEIGCRALWQKMAPRSLILERVRVYEMTLEPAP